MTDMMTRRDPARHGPASAWRWGARTSPARPARPVTGATPGSSASTPISPPPSGSVLTRSARSAKTRKAAGRHCQCGSISWRRRCGAGPSIGCPSRPALSACGYRVHQVRRHEPVRRAHCSRRFSSNMLHNRASIDYSDEVGAETVEPATGDDSLF